MRILMKSLLFIALCIVLMTGCESSKTKQIIGTYEFQVHISNTDNVITGYSYKGFSREKRIVGTIDGIEYMVVHSDMRVTILEPNNIKKYVGEVDEVGDGVFSVKCSNRDGTFGRGYTLYRSGQKIGTAGSEYGGYETFVVDTKKRRVYKSIEDYKNSDISDTEYIMYDKFDSNIKSSNTTEWHNNYYDTYKNRY